jgi:predicted transcriptional regulator
MTERKIAKQLSINDSIVSDSITNLMLHGVVERFRKRRMHFSSREYFVATMEGLEALEAITRQNNNILNDLSSVLKDNVERILLEVSEKSLAFRLTFGAAKSTYKIAKFILK